MRVNSPPTPIALALCALLCASPVSFGQAPQQGNEPKVKKPKKVPDEFRENMLRGIVGFEMPIRCIEGKFKLGQNRSEADQARMLSHLQSGGHDSQRLAEFIVRQTAVH